MPKAARLGDSIGHTPPGEGPQGGGGDVTGKIIGPCSGNVFTNGIKAARAFVDMTVCSLHPQAPLPIATGSSTVFINGLPAARVSDKIVCRAYITDGSANVFIGGAAVQTNSFLPEGIFEEVVELVENGATLVLGAGKIVVGGFYSSAVRIGAGLASIPYMLDSVDAAVGVQKEIANGLNYDFRSDGAKQICEALKPVGAYVQERITTAKDFSEEYIGIGGTAVVFGGGKAAVEIVGVVTGGKVVKSFIDLPLPVGKKVLNAAGQGAGKPVSSKLSFHSSLNPLEKIWSVEASKMLVENFIASRSYQRLQLQRTHVEFLSDPKMVDMGLFDQYNNTVTINMALHSSAKEVISTIIHEAKHQHRFFRTGEAGTIYEEYLAFMSESLFMTGVRPSRVERIIYIMTSKNYMKKRSCRLVDIHSEAKSEYYDCKSNFGCRSDKARS